MSDYFWTNKEQIVSEVLEPLFKLGLSVTKVSKYAGIPQRTLQSWIEKDEILRLKVTIWQNELSLVARKTIANKLTDTTVDNVALSQWWLKHKERDEFSERSEITQQSVSYEDIKEMMRKNLLEAQAIEEKMKPVKGLYSVICVPKQSV